VGAFGFYTIVYLIYIESLRMTIFFLCIVLFQTYCISLHAMEGIKPSHFTFDSCKYSVADREVICSSATGQGLRRDQLDRVVVSEKNDRWGCAVFDGHGNDVIVAQKLANPETGLLPFILDSKDALSKDYISEKFIQYDKENFEKLPTAAGSTAVTFFLDKKEKDSDKIKFFMAHCGDSPGCLIDLKKEEIIYHTQDHKPTDPDEDDRINKAGGFVFNDRVNNLLAMSRAFGNWHLKGRLKVPNESSPRGFTVVSTNEKLAIPNPAIFEAELTGKPIVGIIYSDGFSDGFSSDSKKKPDEFKKILASIICTLIKNGRPIETLAQDLIKLMFYNKSIDKIHQDITGNKVNLAEDFHFMSISEANKRASDLFNDKKLDPLPNTTSTAEISQDNVSLIVFKIGGNEEDGYETEDEEQISTESDETEIAALSKVDAPTTPSENLEQLKQTTVPLIADQNVVNKEKTVIFLQSGNPICEQKNKADNSNNKSRQVTNKEKRENVMEDYFGKRYPNTCRIGVAILIVQLQYYRFRAMIKNFWKKHPTICRVSTATIIVGLLVKIFAIGSNIRSFFQAH
jgi:serine/threonine protein phosphatase PrpC